MKKYVFNTVVLGHCLHLLLLVSIDIGNTKANEAEYRTTDLLYSGTGVVVLIFGLLLYVAVSLPSLYLSRYAVKKILQYDASVREKFFFWIAAASLIVFLHMVVFAILIWDEWYAAPLAFTPALIATLLAILISCGSFKKLACEYQQSITDQQ